MRGEGRVGRPPGAPHPRRAMPSEFQTRENFNRRDGSRTIACKGKDRRSIDNPRPEPRTVQGFRPPTDRSTDTKGDEMCLTYNTLTSMLCEDQCVHRPPRRRWIRDFEPDVHPLVRWTIPVQPKDPSNWTKRMAVGEGCSQPKGTDEEGRDLDLCSYNRTCNGNRPFECSILENVRL